MISTVKREITIEKELRFKIEWACTFSNCEPKIKLEVFFLSASMTIK